MKENKRETLKLSQKWKNKNGITIISLVVTIVVLIVLATITINTLFNTDGLLSKSKKSVEVEENKAAFYTQNLIETEQIYTNIMESDTVVDDDIRISKVVWNEEKGSVVVNTRSAFQMKYRVGNAGEWTNIANGGVINNLINGDTLFVKLVDNTEATINEKQLEVRDLVSPDLSISLSDISQNALKIKAAAVDYEYGMPNDISYSYYIKQANGEYSSTPNYTGDSEYIPTLSANTNYSIKVTAQDKAGNIATKEITSRTLGYYKIAETEYSTLAEAMSAVNDGQTILVLKGREETTAPSLGNKEEVKLDLRGETITLNGVYLTNGGELDIYSSINGGILRGSSEKIILNNGDLTTNGLQNTGTMSIINTSSVKTATIIENNANKDIKLNTKTNLNFSTAANYQENDSTYRYVIKNNGTLDIEGATITNKITSSINDRGVINNSTGRVIMNSGTIDTYGVGIYSNRNRSGYTSCGNIWNDYRDNTTIVS